MDRRAASFFVLSSLFFGGTFVAAKAGLEYFPPLLFVALRFDVAAVLLGGYVLLTSSREELLPTTRGDLLGILATGGLVIGLSNALLFVGQQYATSAVGAIVFSLNPILTPVFAAVLLSNERLSVHGAVGMGLGLLGVILVVSPILRVSLAATLSAARFFLPVQSALRSVRFSSAGPTRRSRVRFVSLGDCHLPRRSLTASLRLQASHPALFAGRQKHSSHSAMSASSLVSSRISRTSRCSTRLGRSTPI